MYDDLDGDEARRAAVIKRVCTEGVEAAYETSLAICKDTRAPAQARAIASRTIFQIAGMLNKPEMPTDKPLYEMTAEELEQSRRGLMRKLSGRSQTVGAEQTAAPDVGVFG
jgi:hypothetical protein